jgi:uncharacterized RDD family membrane protein YckC
MATGFPTAASQPPLGRGTPGAVPQTSDLPRAAGFWLRFWGWLFDTTILSLVVALLSYLVKLAFGVALISFLAGLMERGFTGDMGGLLALLAFVLTWLSVLVVSWLVGQLVGWVYYVFFESSSAQATPGKRLLSLCVVDQENGRISFLRATLRHFFKFAWLFPAIVAFLLLVGRARGGSDSGSGLWLFALSLLITPLLFFIFYGMAGWTRRKRALHDVLSGCYVVRSREVAPTAVFTLALASVAAFLAVQIFLNVVGLYPAGVDRAPAATRVEAPAQLAPPQSATATVSSSASRFSR